MMFELRINNIIWSLYCEPAPSFTLQARATTPSIYLYTYVLLALTVGFQIFSPSLTYIPAKRLVDPTHALTQAPTPARGIL